EEGAFQGVVAVDSAAAEAGRLADRVQAGDGLAAGAEGAGVEVGLDAAEGLAGQDVELYPDQRAGLRVEEAVRRDGAAEPVAEEAAGVVDALDLRVLAVRVAHLEVAGLDLAAQPGRVEQGLVGESVHLRHELLQGGG